MLKSGAITSEPTKATLGFILPSSVGPWLEYIAIGFSPGSPSFLSSEPTVITSSAEPGVPI
ncbi:MAG: Uncharacterised protein [Methanobacteriota archaeon]|nr:MAG: Uncharacterised protein [Euryarchaeota archaeon]